MTYEQIHGQRDQISKIGGLEECPRCHKSLKELDLNAPNGIVDSHLNELPNLRCSSCGFVIASQVY